MQDAQAQQKLKEVSEKYSCCTMDGIKINSVGNRFAIADAVSK